MTTIDFRTALREALDEELAARRPVILFGEDVALGGRRLRRDARALREVRAGARVRHADLGARDDRRGLRRGDQRPAAGARDHVRRLPRRCRWTASINQASKYWFLSGERQSVPLVIRSVVGAGGRFGAIHSQMPISWLTGVPGLKIVAPSTPALGQGAAARRRSATTTRCSSSSTSGCTRRRGRWMARGRADRRRRGRPRGSGHHARQRDEGRRRLPRGGRRCWPATGISAEVIDLQTIRPLDAATVLRSLAKTNRIAVVEEGPLTGGWAGEVIARVTEQGLGDIDDAWRITTPDTPMPVQPAARGRLPPGRPADRSRDPPPSAVSGNSR